MAKLKSSYLNIEFEFNAFESQENGEAIQIVSHESLEDIIHNQVPKELQARYDYNEMVVGRDHCVIRCTISDAKGRRVQAIGESVPETLETEISRCYPAVMAAQRAFDRAVIRYLGFSGKTLSNSEGVDNSGTDNGGTDVDVNATIAEAAQMQNAQAAPNGNVGNGYNAPQNAGVPAQGVNPAQPQNYANNANMGQRPAQPAPQGNYNAQQGSGAPNYQQGSAPMQYPQQNNGIPANMPQNNGQQAQMNGRRAQNASAGQMNGAPRNNQQMPPQNGQPAANDPGAVICNCVGKYRGQNLTIAQVYQMDPQFIGWIAGAYQPVDEYSANIKNAAMAFMSIVRR